MLTGDQVVTRPSIHQVASTMTEAAYLQQQNWPSLMRLLDAIDNSLFVVTSEYAILADFNRQNTDSTASF